MTGERDLLLGHHHLLVEAGNLEIKLFFFLLLRTSTPLVDDARGRGERGQERRLSALDDLHPLPHAEALVQFTLEYLHDELEGRRDVTPRLVEVIRLLRQRRHA